MIEIIDELMESKRDGFFDCDMNYCVHNINNRCTNSCYIDCHYFSIKNSLRELVRTYEEIVTKL